MAARDLTVSFAIEFSVEKRDRTTAEYNRMVDMMENRWHFAEHRINGETAEEQQQAVSADERHQPVSFQRRFGRGS
jgi:hypothetical protein